MNKLRAFFAGGLIAFSLFGGLPQVENYPRLEQFSPIQEVEAANYLSIVPSADGVLYSAYPAGNAPVAGSCPSGWTCAVKGTGVGQTIEVTSSQFTITTAGTNDLGNIVYSYKSCGVDNCQVKARIPATWTGHLENFTGFGVGLTESTADAAYFVHAWIANTGGIARCKYGTPAANSSVSGSAASLPHYVAVTNDDTNDEIRCLQSSDGTTYTTFATIPKVLADNSLGYVWGTSHTTSASTTAALTGIAQSTTIDTYTPAGGGGGPTLAPGGIPNQTATQGTPYSLAASSYFTGATSYSMPTTGTAEGLPTSTGLSFNTSSGLLSGTPAAADVGTRSLKINGINGGGTTPATFAFTGTSSSGTTHVSADVTDATTTTIDCDTFDGGVVAGDTIKLSADGADAGSMRGKVIIRDCIGNASNYIRVINDTAASSPVKITTTAQNAIECNNCAYVIFDGSGGWSGHTNGCGWVPVEAAPRTDCGILANATGQFGFHATGSPRKFITIKGIEVDGDYPGGAVETGMDVAISWNDQSTCASDNPGEWVEGMVVTQNYLHDVAHEVLYVGPNVVQTCGSITGDVFRVKNATVTYNWAENGGWDGMNLKSAYAGTNEVGWNRFHSIGGGTNVSGAESVGISIYEGHATVHDNWADGMTNPPGEGHCYKFISSHAPAGVSRNITAATKANPAVFTTSVNHGYSTGDSVNLAGLPGDFGSNLNGNYYTITVTAADKFSIPVSSAGYTTYTSGGTADTGWGLQTSNAYGNICDENDGDGFAVFRTPGSAQAALTVNIYNNTIVGADGNGVTYNNSGAANGFVKDNIISSTGGVASGVSAPAQISVSNNRTGARNTQGFVSAGADGDNAATRLTHDFRLTSGSGARNQGTPTCPALDMLGTVRPKGGTCDQGSFEFIE